MGQLFTVNQLSNVNNVTDYNGWFMLWKLSPENDNSSLTDYNKDNCFYQEMSFI